MATKRANSSGFTLIELVMVIVILGILAVTVLPKFIDLSGEANTAVNAYSAGVTATDTKLNAACTSAGIAAATCNGD